MNELTENSVARRAPWGWVVLGILAWGTGQFAAYTAFAHRRPLVQ